MIDFVALHESNRIAVFSPRLSEQIPRSRAANAFNATTDALYRAEIVRLCTFWDKPSLERESILTVVELIESKEVRKALAEEHYRAHANRGVRLLGEHDHETAKVLNDVADQYQEEFACHQAKLSIKGLYRSTVRAQKLINSDKLRGVIAHRNNRIAHSLKLRPSAVETMSVTRYGDERELFEETLWIVRELHLWINGSDFDFAGSRKMAARNASELWNACAFDVPKR